MLQCPPSPDPSIARGARSAGDRPADARQSRSAPLLIKHVPHGVGHIIGIEDPPRAPVLRHAFRDDTRPLHDHVHVVRPHVQRQDRPAAERGMSGDRLAADPPAVPIRSLHGAPEPPARSLHPPRLGSGVGVPNSASRLCEIPRASPWRRAPQVVHARRRGDVAELRVEAVGSTAHGPVAGVPGSTPARHASPSITPRTASRRSCRSARRTRRSCSGRRPRPPGRACPSPRSARGRCRTPGPARSG